MNKTMLQGAKKPRCKAPKRRCSLASSSTSLNSSSSFFLFFFVVVVVVVPPPRLLLPPPLLSFGSNYNCPCLLPALSFPWAPAPTSPQPCAAHRNTPTSRSCDHPPPLRRCVYEDSAHGSHCSPAQSPYPHLHLHLHLHPLILILAFNTPSPGHSFESLRRSWCGQPELATRTPPGTSSHALQGSRAYCRRRAAMLPARTLAPSSSSS